MAGIRRFGFVMRCRRVDDVVICQSFKAGRIAFIAVFCMGIIRRLFKLDDRDFKLVFDFKLLPIKMIRRRIRFYFHRNGVRNTPDIIFCQR